MASLAIGDWLGRQPPEFRLLVDATAAAEPDVAPREGIDWDAFQGLAKRHWLASLAFRNLTKDDGSWVPPEARSAMRDELRALVGRNLRMTAETLRICRTFAAVSVPHFVLKGAALGEAIYGNAGLRDSADIDILVPQGNASHCLAMLQDMGYRRRGGAFSSKPALSRFRGFVAKGWLLYNAETDKLMELHWRLNENPYCLPLPADFWRHGAGPRGEGFPTLPPMLWALFLACHGSVCHFTQLKWLTDLHVIQARFPEITPQTLLAEAERHGVSRPVRQTLTLLALVYGTELPAGLLPTVEKDRVLRYLVADSLRALESPVAMGGVRSLRHGVEVIHRLRYRLTLSNRLPYRMFEIVRPLWRWSRV